MRKKNVPSKTFVREKFLVRPKRLIDESINGYLWRAFEENGFRNPAEISGAMTTSGNISADVSALESLKYLLSLSEEEFHSLSEIGSDVSLCSSSKSNLFLASLLEYRVACGARRICTLCQEESLYHRAIWQLLWYIACHYHLVWLTHECEKCGRPLSWESGSLQYCSCGFNLHNSTLRKTNQSTSDLYSRLLSSNNAQIDQISTAQSIASLEIKYVVSIQVLCGIHSDSTSINTSIFKVKSFEIQQKLLVDAGNTYEHWPFNFFELLIHTHRIKIHHHWKGIAVEAPPLEWEYIENLALSTLLPNFISKELKQFIATYRVPSSWKDFYFYPPSGTTSHDKKISTSYYCSYAEAVDLLRIDNLEFQFLIDNKLIPAKKIFSNGLVAHFVPRYILEDAFIFYENTLSFSETAFELGLSTSALDSLIRYKIINLALKAPSQSFCRIRKTDIAKLTADLEAIAHPIVPDVAPEIGYSLSDWLRVTRTTNPNAEFGLAVKLFLHHQAKFGMGCSKLQIFNRLIVTRTTWRQILELFPFIEKTLYDEQMAYSRMACSCNGEERECWRDIEFRMATYTKVKQHRPSIQNARMKAIKTLPLWLRNRHPSPFEPLKEE